MARRYKGIAVPFYFHEQTANEFVKLKTHDSDVFMTSPPKSGTTWINRIVYLLLHGISEDGRLLTPELGYGHSGKEPRPGAHNQVYPDALPLLRPSTPTGPDDFIRNMMTRDYGYGEDLVGQSTPRFFCTHLPGEGFLPAELLAPGGKGRLVVMLRNLKDVMCSMHFFRGEPKDGWKGNEHGPGTLARFLDPNSENAYGNAFLWIKRVDASLQALRREGRVHVMYFEDLKVRLPEEVRSLAAFLGVPVSAEKVAALARAVGFDSMRNGLASITLRKGAMRDWVNHLGPDDWAEFDSAFATTLGGCALAEPMLAHQQDDSRASLDNS